MKNDKDNNLGALKDELNQKVESIMGPVPENPNTLNRLFFYYKNYLLFGILFIFKYNLLPNERCFLS